MLHPKTFLPDHETETLAATDRPLVEMAECQQNFHDLQPPKNNLRQGLQEVAIQDVVLQDNLILFLRPLALSHQPQSLHRQLALFTQID
jgi:hypothetical protein